MRLFEPVVTAPASLQQRIVDQIQRALAEGRLKPGDRLPGERELCQMLGVSRSSLREAIKVLAGKGVVEARQGQGVFIARADPVGVLEQIASVLLLQRGTVADLFEVRRLLETQAAAWAAERASPAECAEMAALLEECLAKAESGRITENEYEQYDHRFHFLLAKATGNEVLVRVMANLIDLLVEARKLSLKVPGRARRSVDDHLAVLAAVRAGDPEAARRRMLEHLEGVQAAILDRTGGSRDGARER